MAAEPTCCAKVKVTTAIIIIAVIYIVIGLGAILLTAIGRVPEENRIAFLVYGVLQIDMAALLILAALREWTKFLWLFFVFACICLVFALVILLVSIANQWNIQTFLAGYKWLNPEKSTQDQETKGHIIQGLYSAFVVGYIVFTIFALTVVKKCYDYFKEIRNYGNFPSVTVVNASISE
uniref:MARVEL domain-containing protein n=1 Tax=Steinernema glaseri TaxID=37863 RepID=A0A1I7ZHT4_9BILA